MTWAAIIAFSGICALAVLSLHIASKANRRTRLATARAETAENKIDALAEWIITTFDMTPEDFPIEIELADADVGPLTEN